MLKQQRSRLMRAMALGLGLTLVARCSSSSAGDDADGGRLKVAASFYPLQYLAERIGGPDVEVAGLTPPGTEPHDLTLTGPTRAAAAEADVLLHVGGGYQPEISSVVEQHTGNQQALDMLTVPGLELLPADGDDHDDHGDHGGDSDSGHGADDDEHGSDPHVWLDPVRFATVARAVTDAFAAARPEQRADLERRRDAVLRELDQLHQDLRAATAQCATRTLITNHAAFGYLADRYDLRQVPIAGLSPEQEPAPAVLGQVAEEARQAGVRTIFAEEGVSAKLTQTVADEAGTDVAVLAVLEFTPSNGDGASGTDYPSRMRANAQALRSGLECR